MTADSAAIRQTIETVRERLAGGRPLCRQTPGTLDSSGFDAISSLRFISDKASWLRGPIRPLREMAATLSLRLSDDLDAAARISGDFAPPILMVCGSVNSGKSSLIASFLSEANRPRVLTGRGDEEGTHRFVFWAPQRWRDDEEKRLRFVRLLAEVFPRSPEDLATEPETAARQYNARGEGSSDTFSSESDAVQTSRWETPLIAYDSRLDELGLAMLDCPDVQSGGWGGGASGHRSAQDAAAVAQRRFKALIGVGRIASAAVVVAAASSLGDAVLASLVDSLRANLPRTDLFLAVNQVPKRYSPQTIALDVAQYDWAQRIDALYMAYDFRGQAAAAMRDRLPLHAKQVLAQTDDLPDFFLLDAEASASPGYPETPDRYLLAIAKSLRPSEMQRQYRESTVTRLVRTARESQSLLQQYADESAHRDCRLVGTVRNAIIELTATPRSSATPADKEFVPKLQLSRTLLTQIEGSLERTAPAYARVFLWPSFRIKRWFQTTKQAAESYVPAIANLGGQLRRHTDAVLAKFAAGKTGKILTERRFGEALRRYDSAGDLPTVSIDADLSSGTAADAVTVAAVAAIDRFQRASDVQMNTDQLDQLTTQLWKTMPIGQRLKTTLAPAAMVIAPLAAVVMIPFDMGTTHVLVYASLKELLVAGIAGASWAAWKGDQLPSVAEVGAAWRQLADLYATTCDALAIERHAARRASSSGDADWPGGSARWCDSGLPVQIDFSSSLAVGLSIDAAAASELSGSLGRLEKAVEA